MDIVSYTFTGDELQARLNNVKDQVIDAINTDTGQNIDKGRYVLVLERGGNLGAWMASLLATVFGQKLEQNETRAVLLRVEVRPTAVCPGDKS